MKTFLRSIAVSLLALLSGSSQAADSAAPTVRSISPAPESALNALGQVTIVFSEPVTGVQASDLQVNGESASQVASVGTTNFTFSFTQPATGPDNVITVMWDEDNSITDLAGNLFDSLAPGGIWHYKLADSIPPRVARQTPAAGAAITTLTQIEVVFSEGVSGVDASDLLINGRPASSVKQEEAGTYLFEVAQPSSGVVSISWAGNHNIRDLAGNSLGDAGWSYALNPAERGDVVINEILTENLAGLLDEDSQKHDWIELFNRGTNSVNLVGWALTDDPEEPGKWTFPALTMAPGSYLVVYASGKDRKTTSASATNHTNFRLNLSPMYLGLFNAELPRGQVSAFAPAYPEQRGDVSYGRTADGTLAYFAKPTPGAPNTSAIPSSGFASPPHASVKSGFFDQSFNVVLTSETAGAVIRYTTNGAAPTASSPAYTGPIGVAGNPLKAVFMLRAAAFANGLLPSTVTTHTYIFPDHVLTQPAKPAGFPAIWDSPCDAGILNCNDINPADYEMDPQVITNTVYNYKAVARQGLVSIPTVSIVTDVNLLFSAAQGVYVRREPWLRNPINAEFITTDGSPGFQIDCGLEMQGQTSPDDSSTGGSKWKSLKLGLRLFFQGEFGPTKLHYKVFEDSPMDTFDTLMLAGGHNNYWNYNNNDTQRVRALYVRDQYIANLQNAASGLSHHGRFVHLYLNGLYWGLYQLHERPDASFQASYHGGDKKEWDVFKHDSSQVVNGSVTNYTAMWTVINAGLANITNYEKLQTFLDVPNLIDYMLVNFWGNNTDWAHKNLYASRRKIGGLWRFHAWDSEHTIETAANDYDALNDNEGTNPGAIFTRLVTNSEFRVLLGDHFHKHFFNGGLLYTDPLHPVYDPAFPERNQPARRFMQMLKQIDTAIVCESARWGDVGPGRENSPHLRDTSFYDERDMVMGYKPTSGQHTPVYFPARSTNMINEFRRRGWYPSVAAPAFSQHGGRVPSGYNLVISNLAAGAQVYYTTNGVDPRVYASGAIAPSARQLDGTPITLSESGVVKARALAGTNWSALNEAEFAVASLGIPLRFTEIMYRPKGADSESFEFIELKNVGNAPLALGGYRMEGVSFIFPASATLAPGALLVLASDKNPVQFAQRYPNVVVFGYFNGSLDNGGERLAVLAPNGSTILSVTYDDEKDWPEEADGGGSSLEIIDPLADQNDPANWRASAPGGTPGIQPAPASLPNVVLNEVAAENLTTVTNGGAHPDWVELFNRGAQTVNLGNWSLSDGGSARRFVFPANTTLAAGAYLAVWCDTNNAAPGLHTGFALDADGEHLFLYDASTNRVDAISFGKQLVDYTIGRVGDNWELTKPTPGAANIPATAGSATNLAINEWVAKATPGASDWIELFNRSSSVPVSLRNLYIATSNDLSQIKALSFLAPGGFIRLFADESPGANHLDFKLNGDGDSIALFDETGAPVERVTFGAQAEGFSQGRLPDGSASLTMFTIPTPGESNHLVTSSGPLLNEILARNLGAITNADGRVADFVEIFNPANTPWTAAGWSLSIDANQPGQWPFPAGLIVPAQGYAVVWCDGDRAAGNLNTGRSINAESGSVFLFDPAGRVADFVEFGFQVADKPIGRNGNNWSLLENATPGAANAQPAVLGDSAGIRINEWMAASRTGDDWFELYNTGSAPVDLSGLSLTDDASLVGRTNHVIAPLTFIGAQGFVAWHADGDAGKGRDHVGFRLNADGQTLRLYQPSSYLVDAVDFALQTKGVSQGRLPDGAAAIISFTSTATPGESNYLPLRGALINEVLTHTDAPLEDAIELFNPTSQPVAIGGWYLSDNGANLKKFQIPANTILAPLGFKVFFEADLNGGAGSLAPFTFDSVHGDGAYLSEADTAGNLTGYRAVAKFGPSENGVSFGRYQTSLGDDFVAQGGRTFGNDNPTTLAQFRTSAGAANSGPKVGPIVINELMYQPPANAGGDNTADEYIELFNGNMASTALFDSAVPTNTWHLRGGVEFEFPAGVTIGSRGFLLLVNFDPANPAALTAFRAKYSVAASVPVYGPYRGKLNNDRDSIELYKPDPPQGPGPDQGFVPYVLVDRVSYDFETLWPAGAAGTGNSLQRRRPFAYGNEPANWKAELPTAGRANLQGSGFADADGDGLPDAWETTAGLNPNNANDAAQDLDGDGQSNYEEFFNGTNPSDSASRLLPVSIGSKPQNVTVLPGANASFQITAAGSAPLSYQWRLNGLLVPGATNATLDLVGVRAENAGEYTAVAVNPGGFAISAPATLTVNPSPITQQPQSQTVSNGGSVTFTVAAAGTGTLRYQWRFNGVDIAGATSASLTLNNIAITNMGTYAVLVSDSVGSVLSDPAELIVLAPPVIVQQPQSQTVATGSSVTFTVTATGTPPLGYRWRRNNVNISFKIGDPTLTIPNAQAANAGTYTVVVTNALLTAGVTSSPAVLTLGAPPVISAGPASQSVEAGGTVTFSVTAAGDAPLGYQWKFANQPIANATSPTLVLTNVQTASQGSYTVTVTNLVGTASASASLTVLSTAPVLSNPRMLPGGQFRMDLSGKANTTYEIQVSPSALNWVALTNILSTGGSISITDAPPANTPRRFYRARQTP